MKDRLFNLSAKVKDLSEKAQLLKKDQQGKPRKKLDSAHVINFLKFFAKDR